MTSIPEGDEEPEPVDAPNLGAPSSTATMENELPPVGELSPTGGISWTEADTSFPACQPQQEYNDRLEKEYYQEHANHDDLWEPETVTDTAPVGELSPVGAETGNPRQAHEASVSRNAVEAEMNSLNQISSPYGPGCFGEMIDAFEADDDQGEGQGSNPANSPPAGWAMVPSVPLHGDAEGDDPVAYNTSTVLQLLN